MKRKFLFFSLVLALAATVGCKKEVSFETGVTPAQGSLQSETGDCLPKSVNGSYQPGKALNADSNTITVTVDVDVAGAYTITTDTVNGYYFRATGIFPTSGTNSVSLLGHGTPVIGGLDNFTVTFDSTSCTIQVPVSPPATYTIENTGSPASCSGATASGNYIIGSVLNSSNTVTLSVDVTAAGSYDITTAPVNGMTFSGSGLFTTTGTQTVVLTGKGTPTGTAGDITVPVTAGSSTCNFTVPLSAGAQFTFDCSSATPNGTYQAGVALTGANTVTATINVTSVGPYNITTTTVNGMTFTASGTFVATGNTSLTLNGSGTPTSSGVSSIPAPGTSPCTFAITITAGATVDWTFTSGGTTYSGSTGTADLESTTSGPVTVTSLTIAGTTTTPTSSNQLEISLINTSGPISTGTYSGTTASGKGATFLYSDGVTGWWSSPGIGSNMDIVLTVFDPANHIVKGTFAGTAKDSPTGGNNVTITAGSFQAALP